MEWLQGLKAGSIVNLTWKLFIGKSQATSFLNDSESEYLGKTWQGKYRTVQVLFQTKPQPFSLANIPTHEKCLGTFYNRCPISILLSTCIRAMGPTNCVLLKTQLYENIHIQNKTGRLFCSMKKQHSKVSMWQQLHDDKLIQFTSLSWLYFFPQWSKCGAFLCCFLHGPHLYIDLICYGS